MKKLNINFLIGIFFLIAGILLCVQKLFSNLAIDFSVIWWAYFALIGVFVILNDRRLSIVPSIFIVVGVWNVLHDLDIVNSSIFSLIWPIILIVVGVNLVFNKHLFHRGPNVVSKEGALEYNGVFGGVNERIRNSDFKGATLNACFGAVELDLRDVEIKEESVQISISAIFGGVDVILPDKYNIVINDSLALFGGTDNKHSMEQIEGRKTIYLDIRTIFGGAELK